MKDQYIFLTRNNNDLDHLTAILYKDFINISDKCLIIIFSNENLSSNPRIEVLKNLGFKMVNFWLYCRQQSISFDGSSFYFDLGSLITLCKRILNKLKLTRLFNFIKTKSDISYDKTIKLTEIFLSGHMNLDNCKVLFFDIQANATYPQKQFCDIVKAKNIKVIMYHHAVINYDNNLCYNSHISQQSTIVNYQLPFDNIVVYEQESKNRIILESGSNNVSNIGSYRFSKDYILFAQNIFKNQIAKLNQLLPKNQLKILLLLHKPVANYWMEEIYRIINTILVIDNIHLTIQSHTRGWAKDVIGLIKKNIKTKHNILTIDSNEYSTTALFATTDLILFTSTSVIYEAIVIDKPVLHLSRTTSNRNYIDNMIKSYNVETRDDLINEIEKAKKDKNYRSYSEEERACVLNFLSTKDVKLSDLL